MTENIIKKFAEDKGILIGICGAEPMDWLRPRLEGRTVPFVRYSVDRRIDPGLSLASARSIIVMAKNYRLKPQADVPVKLAMYARQDDYHHILKDLLLELRDLLLLASSFESYISADTGPLLERELANLCGLGFIGKNHSLITDEFGSFVNLGYMITSLALEPTATENKKSCGDCRLCIDACPGKAITDDNVLAYERCVSFITQTKRPLSDGQKVLIDDYIFGCDICQTVCPKNFAKPCADNDALPNLDPEYILGMTESEFQKCFAKTPISWAGREILIRNLRIKMSQSRSDSGL